MQLVSDQQTELNRNLYAKAPTIEQIESFLKEAEIIPRKYERMVGMRLGTIADVKCGYRPLPLKFWHLVFCKIIPTWGAISGFQNPTSQIRTKIRNTHEHKPVYTINNSTNILDKLKNISD